MSNFYHHEPKPTTGDALVLEWVMQALEERAQVGYEKYGSLLTTFNGRDPLWDAFEEALDLTMYLAQAVMEKEALKEQETENNPIEIRKKEEKQERDFCRYHRVWFTGTCAICEEYANREEE